MERLDKVLAQYQFGSRSEVKKLIKKQGVFVNHKLILDETFKINEADLIQVGKTTFEYHQYLYLMMNKQKNRICSHDEISNSIYNDLPAHLPNDLFTVGRLDKDTTGLIFITNDGQWAHHITKKDSDIIKYYLITCQKPFIDETNQLFNGIDLDKDGVVSAKTLEVLDEYHLILGISDGKYHQVKRMMHALDNEVLELHRLQIGHVKLDSNLKAGQTRFLSKEEINLALC